MDDDLRGFSGGFLDSGKAYFVPSRNGRGRYAKLVRVDAGTFSADSVEVRIEYDQRRYGDNPGATHVRTTLEALVALAPLAAEPSTSGGYFYLYTNTNTRISTLILLTRGIRTGCLSAAMPMSPVVGPEILG